jgi:hypothetical protein
MPQALIHIDAGQLVWPQWLPAHRRAHPVTVQLRARCHLVGCVVVPPGEPCLVEAWQPVATPLEWSEAPGFPLAVVWL